MGSVNICGHTRYYAAQKLELQRVPVIVAEMTKQKARAYRLADNKVGEYSTWDEVLLAEELEELKGIDMELYGFDSMDAVKDKDYQVKELDLGGFEDERYRYCCKECGFKFN